MELGVEYSRALLWIVLLPLVGAILNGFFGRYASKKVVSALGVGTVAASFLLAVVAFVKLFTLRNGEVGDEARLVYHVYEWFSLGFGQSSVPVNVRFVMDSLSGIMTLVVTGIGLLIHIYSTGYMHDDPGYPRFFAYLNLFTASMLILVLASNLPLMFVGWEGVGVCSYLLIGFWYKNRDYAAAGRKAFVANRVGDFGVLIGMFALVTVVGSFEFADINKAGYLGDVPFTLGTTAIGSVATVAALFLFLGCTGKSAQIPLYVWLPDAMAGPTPVSALIHAATMVTSGIYLTVRLSPVFVQSSTAMAVIAIVGAATALLAASIALVQNEMKKILAYSTVSQLGFMFAGVGVGAFAAGFFHVFTHAFFKACLFLGAGSVMHAVGAHGDANIHKLGGLRRIMPTTHWTFFASCLAIAGVPLTSGFFSKDEILLGAALLGGHSEGLTGGFAELAWVGWVVFVTLVIAATMTAFYMFRLYFLTFSGEYRSHAAGHAEGHEEAHGADEAHDEHEHAYAAHPHESPPSMAVPLIVLGAGALVVGYLGMPHAFHFPNFWNGWLKPALAFLPGRSAEDLEPMSLVWTALLAGTVAMAIGIGSAYALYFNKAADPVAEKMPAGLYRLLMDKWRVDELYQAVILGPLAKISLVLGYLDRLVVDGLLTRATSMAVAVGGYLFTRIQNGVVYTYGAVLTAGVAAVTLFFLYPRIDVEAKAEQDEVQFAAARGLGYSYRWDLTSDGEFDTEWDASRPEISHRYTTADYRQTVLLLEGARNAGRMEIVLDEGTKQVIPSDLLGPIADSGESRAEPRVWVQDGKVIVRRNGAPLRVGGRFAQEDEVTLDPGSRGSLGGAALVVGGRVRATVEIQNAFGNIRSRAVDVTVAPSSGDSDELALEVHR